MTKIDLLCYKLKRELQLIKYADSTINTYASCLRVFLTQHKKFNNYNSIEDVKDFLLTIENRNYHKQMVATIHHFYRKVVKQPLTIFDIPYPKPSHYLPEVLSIQEVSRLILSIQNIKHKAAIQVMYSCALRIGEVTKIEIHHVDGQRKLLLVKGAKGFKDRYVPLPEPTLILLRNYYQQQQPKPKKYLFEGQYGDQYSVRSLQQIFHRACKKAGIIKSVTPHCLRHSRLTHLKEAGLDIYELKDIAGHIQIKTTEIYLHLAKESLVNRVAQADAILSSIAAPQKQLINVA